MLPANDNLKANLIVNKDSNKADLSITSFAMRNPVKMQMDWDPVSNFEKILLQQIEEIERLEFAEETQTQNNRDSNTPTELQNEIGKNKSVNNVNLEE